MNPYDLITTYYPPGSDAREILIDHSRSVADKALQVARLHPEMELNFVFIEEAGLLHDIGVFMCDAPGIGCYGEHEYICHGYLGADLLRKEGYPDHALVCERHTGTGISLEMIESANLPLPYRNFMPVSMEEQLICFADKFFSKTKLGKEKSVDQVIHSLSKYGDETVNRFKGWCKLFLGE